MTSSHETINISECGGQGSSASGDDFTSARPPAAFDFSRLPSEQILKSMSDNMGMAEFDLSGAVLRLNRRSLDMFGYAQEELVGKNHKQMCGVETIVSQDYAEMWRALRCGCQVNGVFPRKKRDGSQLWLDTLYVPVTGADGKVEKIVAFALDVTESERQANERERRLDTLENFMLFAEYTPDGTIVNANVNFAATMGYTHQELQGLNRGLFLTCSSGSDLAEAGPETDAIWQEVCAGHMYTGRVEHAASNGESIWLETVYAPVFEGDGRIGRILFFAMDISLQMKREQGGQERMRHAQQAVENTENAMVLTDRLSKIVHVNPAFTRLFGYQPEEITGKAVSVILGARYGEILPGIKNSKKSRQSCASEENVFNKSGRKFWCAVTASSISGEDGEYSHTVIVFTDINSTKMQAILQLKALEAMAHDVSTGEVLSLVCREAESLLPGVIIGIAGLDEQTGLYSLAAPSFPPNAPQALQHLYMGEAHLHEANPDELEMRHDVLLVPSWPALVEPFKTAGWKACFSAPVISSNDKMIGVVCFCFREARKPDNFEQQLIQVMSSVCALALEREKTQAAIRSLAFYDQATGLPNRELLLANAARLFADHPEAEHSVLVIYLECFKRLNDTLGYEAKDALLRRLTRRMLKIKGPDTLVGRVSENSFAVVLPFCDARQSLERAKRVQGVLAKQVEEEGMFIQPSSSIGISMYPQNGRDIESLLSNATLAMDRSSERGLGQCSFFDATLDSSAKEQMAMESELRNAIEHGVLRLVYQPQVLLQRHGLHGVEALCRWEHPEFGQVSPARFVPLAEECGLIDRLGRWTLEESCRQLADWRAKGLRVPAVSVNLSATRFQNAAMPAQTLEMLGRYELKPGDITLELTEGVFLSNDPKTIETINAANGKGFRFFMDDFGIGYSSLSYLQRFPFAELKLDQSFVRDLERSDTSKQLSRAIASLAKSLGLITIAEGIETKEQYELLAGQGYDAAQGYYRARPLPPADFELW